MGWNKTTALMLAAFGGYLDIVEWLCDYGAYIYCVNSLGANALMLAAGNI